MQLIAEFPPDTRFNTCVTCNAARRENDLLIDLEVFIEFEGKLIMCETCVVACANLIGLVSAPDAEKLRTKIRELQTKVDTLEQRASRIKELV